MALLADGLHMGSHASALTVTAFAYYYTRRHARDARFNFGTGKANSLGAFASAVMLVLFAIAMAWESAKRFWFPVSIGFDKAIFVAVVGLLVNGVCLVILREHEHTHRGDGHQHNDHHGHAHRRDDHHESHSHHDHSPHLSNHADHNLWSAYLHVLADALTSLLAIFALLAGKYLGQTWLDPFMGVIGAGLVARWSWALLGSSARVLLDVQAPGELRERIRTAIESQGDNRISDLHVWAVGPAIYAVEIAVISSRPQEPGVYCALLPRELGLVHITVEAHQCVSSRCLQGDDHRTQ
jgi:cation diffusion facilitator family transporter